RLSDVMRMGTTVEASGARRSSAWLMRLADSPGTVNSNRQPCSSSSASRRKVASAFDWLDRGSVAWPVGLRYVTVWLRGDRSHSGSSQNGLTTSVQLVALARPGYWGEVTTIAR